MTGQTLTCKNPTIVNQMEADGVRLFKSKKFPGLVRMYKKGAKKRG